MILSGTKKSEYARSDVTSKTFGRVEETIQKFKVLSCSYLSELQHCLWLEESLKNSPMSSPIGSIAQESCGNACPSHPRRSKNPVIKQFTGGNKIEQTGPSSAYMDDQNIWQSACQEALHYLHAS